MAEKKTEQKNVVVMPDMILMMSKITDHKLNVSNFPEWSNPSNSNSRIFTRIII